MKRPFRSALAALALLAPAAAADVLYLGSSDGLVRSGDPVSGVFNFLAVCGGPIHSMVLDGDDLFIGDTSGSIYHYEAASGSINYSFAATNDATALVLEGGDLLIGGSDATVHRVDKTDGTILNTLNVSVPVGAMTMIEGLLYVGSPAGAIFRGDPSSGPFTFWGTCGGPIQSMSWDSTHVMFGTSSGGGAGTVYRIDRQTQLSDGAFGVTNDGLAMVKHDGDLLIGGSDSSVLRTQRVAGSVKSTFATTFSVDAMALQPGVEPGVAYCRGSAGLCPCGNPDGEAGCANSSGVGALLRGSGTASVTADDLVLHVANIPAKKFARFYMGASAPQNPFGAGLFCAGSGGYGVRRFPTFSSGASGTGDLISVVGWSQANWPANKHIVAGFTWNFQVWYRDPSGPCSTINTSNAYRVAFLP